MLDFGKHSMKYCKVGFFLVRLELRIFSLEEVEGLGSRLEVNEKEGDRVGTQAKRK